MHLRIQKITIAVSTKDECLLHQIAIISVLYLDFSGRKTLFVIAIIKSLVAKTLFQSPRNHPKSINSVNILQLPGGACKE